MVAKDLYFATCVAQPDFRSGVERLPRASSARLRASRDNITKLVAHATDGLFVHFVEVVFFRLLFTLDEVRRTIFVHVFVGEVSRIISAPEHLANMIGCVAMRMTSERVDTTSERHENSGRFL